MMVHQDGSNVIAAAQLAATRQGYARKCNVPHCKRARRCVGPDVRCLTDAMRSLPVRVAGRYVAIGRSMLREAETRGSGALAETQPQRRTPQGETGAVRIVPIIQALMYCIGQSAD